MKKIFTIEINENDKKLKIKKIVNRLDKLFLNFGKELGNEREVYIKFKRVGNTWDSIVSDLNKDSLSKDNKKYLKTKNYLKIIK